jgi:YHS domain-containing protein
MCSKCKTIVKPGEEPEEGACLVCNTSAPLKRKLQFKNGQELRFATSECVKQFLANPGPYIARTSRSQGQPDKAPRNHTLCPVCDQPAKGNSFVQFANGHTLYFACHKCEARFVSNPGAYVVDSAKKTDDSAKKAQQDKKHKSNKDKKHG